MLPLEEQHGQTEHRAIASERSEKRVLARDVRSRKKSSDSPEMKAFLRDLPTEERKAVRAFARAANLQIEIDEAYEAVGRAPEERRRGVPESATKRQRWLVNQDEYRRATEALYGDCPWSPQGPNALQTVWDRIYDRGYVWHGSDVIAKETGDPKAGLINGKYFQYGFVEKGFRTALEPFLLRILEAVPSLRAKYELDETGKIKRDKAGKRVKRDRVPLRSGPRNDDRRYYNTKWAAMDGTYICTHGLKTLIRVDIDADFADDKTLHSKLVYLVREGKLPCLPHIVVWVFDDRYPGKVLRPHLIWFLPRRRGVWGTGRQDALYKAVVKGLTAGCSEIGSDMNGCDNPTDFKNPLSPHTHYRIPNRTVFPSLSEMAEAMDLRGSLATVERLLATKFKIDESLLSMGSQRFWKWAFFEVFEIACNVHLAGGFDPRAEGYDAESFKQRLIELALIKLDATPAEFKPKTSRERESARRAIETRAESVVERFDPEQLKPGADRGACAAAGLIKWSDDTSTRKSAGGRYGSSKRQANSKAAIIEAYKTAIAAGDELTNVYIAKLAIRSADTVSKYARECYQIAMAELHAEQATSEQAADHTIERVTDAPSVDMTNDDTETTQSNDSQDNTRENHAIEGRTKCREGATPTYAIQKTTGLILNREDWMTDRQWFERRNWWVNRPYRNEELHPEQTTFARWKQHISVGQSEISWSSGYEWQPVVKAVVDDAGVHQMDGIPAMSGQPMVFSNGS